ncbi:antibiotic biosynthesis monooxygenase (ABM) superfamily enzyme [Arthrobacter sp. V4I6]|uniref:antibiotic biosynthesis monooxygenase n=1 Tax=unclassified Arthrobacter TaxID=235627 RepID=UPI0027894E3F|nr:MULTISPECIES: antibiotic biosynthesis monooxygenase [unclassified Arthrobacter]MDQ0819171.1 antibiotic biosynthesis monooxygenase (ABM) superfamily enzyme [Arthrobacter sp. V1I7]MDQ0853354.1 antibiotic biosynthesis monooxygenase (ABM) superfamily enzyme [Arthrobacter sp. V4I6]
MAEQKVRDGAVEPAEPVALVVHRRLAESNYPTYEAWHVKVCERLASWPGFLGQEIIEPRPPVQSDWVIVQHFRNAASARAWLHSKDRQALEAEMVGHFKGDADVHLITETTRYPSQAASVLISSRVDPDQEEEFLAWQRIISSAESTFDGFIGHQVQRPVPGVRDHWVVVLSFDSNEHLNAWLESGERAALLKAGAPFNRELALAKTSYGFGFWSGGSPTPDPIFKSNLVVLLMLYPLVFLWGYFVSEPLIDSHGVPFWLSLFIGNLVSTQLLGWFLVPWAFQRFGWWLKRGQPLRVHLYGYAIILALYIVSMALYAWLLGIRADA